jgi:SecD/SecF fusion protein
MKPAALLLTVSLLAPSAALAGASFEMRVVIPCAPGDTPHPAPNGEAFCLSPDVIVDRSNVVDAQKADGRPGPVLRFLLDPAGRKRFEDATTALSAARGRLAILYDGKIVSAPIVLDPISGGQGEIAGFDPAALEAAADDLKAKK